VGGLTTRPARRLPLDRLEQVCWADKKNSKIVSTGGERASGPSIPRAVLVITSTRAIARVSHDPVRLHPMKLPQSRYTEVLVMFSSVKHDNRECQT